MPGSRGELGMATIEATVAREKATRPKLVFFTSNLSGQSRRVEGFLAQVLQRRRNHGTFRLHVVDGHQHPDLVRRFNVSQFPTLVVVEDRTVRARLVQPKGCRDIEELLSPWLR
jgi:thioredoxin-like negative regulator of GroEL